MSDSKAKVQVDPSWVKKMSDLARLELTPDELQLYSSQLQQVLGYVDALQTVPVDGVDPLFQPLDFVDAIREDQVVESAASVDGEPAILAHAPEVIQRGFKVPPILS